MPIATDKKRKVRTEATSETKKENRRQAVVLVHPDAYARASMGRPNPLIKVALETARIVLAIAVRRHLRNSIRNHVHPSSLRW